MLGVIVNVITVIVGSCVGLLFKKGIPERVSNAAMIGLGACTLYIGISGSLCGENVLILIASVVLGAIVGTLLNIDGAINTLAEKVEAKFRKEGPKGISGGGPGFCDADVLRWLHDGDRFHPGRPDGRHRHSDYQGNPGPGILHDAGIQPGCGRSAVRRYRIFDPGWPDALAGVIAPVMNVGAINEITCAGSLLIVMIGTNLMGITKIKVADYLPAILFAPILHNLVAMFG